MTNIKKTKHLIDIARLQFAMYIREKRIQSGFSQMNVAKKLKLKNAQFISNIERGVAPIPFQTLKILMNLYSISYEELAEKYLALQQSVLEAELGYSFEESHGSSRKAG